MKLPPEIESGEYKRECNHGEMCHWKECPECREYLVRKGFAEELATQREQILDSIAPTLADIAFSDDLTLEGVKSKAARAYKAIRQEGL